MFNYGDREIGQDVLTGQKSLASCAHRASVEAVDPRLRQVLSQIHHQTVADAKQVFDYLHSRGWYAVKPASVHAVQEFINTAQQTRQETTGMAGPYGQVTGPVGGYVPGPAGTPAFMGGVGSTGYTGGGGATLPDWARHDVRSPGGTPVYGGGQPYVGTTPMAGTLPQWARHDVQLGQFHQPGGGTAGIHQGGYAVPASYGGYGSGLPAWTRQEIPSEPYRPGQPQPSVYQGYGTYPGQQDVPRGGYTGAGTTGYTGQLPSWTRQEVRDTGYAPGAGMGGHPAYPGGPTGVPAPSIYQGMDAPGTGAGQGSVSDFKQSGRGIA